MPLWKICLLGDDLPGESTRDFAFGTLLHMVQDSFSESHVSRDLSTQGVLSNCPHAEPLTGRNRKVPGVQFATFSRP